MFPPYFVVNEKWLEVKHSALPWAFCEALLKVIYNLVACMPYGGPRRRGLTYQPCVRPLRHVKFGMFENDAEVLTSLLVRGNWRSLPRSLEVSLFQPTPSVLPLSFFFLD